MLCMAKYHCLYPKNVKVVINMPEGFYIQKAKDSSPLWISLTTCETFFKFKFCSSLIFPDTTVFEKVKKNCPYILRYRWLTPENYDFSIVNTKEKTPFSIRWINSDMGYGLFTEEDIKKNTSIGEYVGVVRQLYRYKGQQNPYCFHYPTKFWSFNYFVIDAERQGNLTRFLNHSDNPNLKPICVVDNKILRLFFITNTDIKKGSQLFFDYGKDFWTHRKKVTI